MALITPTISIPPLATGKVRDLYLLPPSPSSPPSSSSDHLLFIASDRISAYDVVLANGIPNKGILLTQLTAHWFDVLPSLIPGGLNHHYISTGVPDYILGLLPKHVEEKIPSRCMVVRKLKVLPVEAIVRGYLAGSAWKEYQAKGTVHGIQLPEGLKQCSPIPGGAIFTPSTKAPAGEHDENIHPSLVASIVGGEKYANKIEELSLAVYKAASAYAEERGIIIADTKFEFGLDETTDELVLVDEVLTSDSSRFWPKDKYEEGRDQESFDKQILRNWLTENGLKGKEGVVIDDEVVKKTEERYRDVFRMLTGRTLEEVLQGKADR